MPWTARLIRTEPHKGFTDFIVEFTDGVQTIEEQFRGGLGVNTNAIKSRVSGRLVQYNSPVKATIPDGETDFTPTPDPPTPPPTQEDLDFQAWRNDVSQLQEVESLVSLGVFQGNNAKVVQLRQSVKDNWNDAFLARLGVS